MPYYDDYLDAIKNELQAGHRQWKRGDKLLEAFGYTRRRQTAIDLINSRLAAKGLVTVPRVTTSMPLDRAITFYLQGTPQDATATTPVVIPADQPVEDIELATEEDGDEESDEHVTVTIVQEAPIADPSIPADRGLIVGNLAAADREPEQVRPTATVAEALTKMALYDYSQLVVTTSPREIKGLVSYQSVAQAYLHGNPETVNDCLDRTMPVVGVDEPLLRVVELFSEHDAVLVVGPDRSLKGIVTAADIASEFMAMAAPFLLIGQVEEQLRWLVQKRLPDLGAALASVGVFSDSSSPPSVSDLTMGELHRVLDNDANWASIGIRFHRAEFCRELNAVREIRNAVMHFKELPDGGADRIKRFASIVQTAYLALADARSETA